MRNGFLGSLLSLLLAVPLAPAQSPALTPALAPPLTPAPLPNGVRGSSGTPAPLVDGERSWEWQPPRTDLDDRPNVSPPGYRYYGSFDYILWWTEKDRPVGPVSAAPVGPAINLLLPQTIDFGSLLRKGLRADLGLWLNPQQSLGLELGGFWVDDRAPGSQGQAGTLGVASQFHSELWGAEAILRAEVYRGTWAHLDVLAGFRYLSLDEALAIEEHDIAANVSTWDRCGTGNCFYGGQLGAETVLHYSRWFLDLWGKAALGVNDQTIDVNGTTVAGGQAFPGGNLASPALLGRHRRDEFAVVPEAGVRLGCELAQHVRVTAGYTFLYLTNAARPGVQIDALLSAPRPSPFPFQSGEFWVQGLNLGVEFRF